MGTGNSKMTVEVAYEELNEVTTSPEYDDDDDSTVNELKVKIRHCPLVLLDIDPEASANIYCERIIETLEKFQVKNRLLTVTVGQCRFMDKLVSELQSMLRDIGIYAINSYATVDSIKDTLSKNLQEYSEHAEDIRNIAEEILNFSKDSQSSVVFKKIKAEVYHKGHSSKMVDKVDKVNQEYHYQECPSYNTAFNKKDQEAHENMMASKMEQYSLSKKSKFKEGLEGHHKKLAIKLEQDHLNDVLLRTLRWDLMPILPGIRWLEGYLSEARTLGAVHNFKIGCDWKRLSQVLKEVRSNLVNGHQCFIDEDHKKILRMLLKKLYEFPESYERAIHFLRTSDLSSPLTQHIFNTAKHMPRTLTKEHANNTLLLKIWTVFLNDET